MKGIRKAARIAVMTAVRRSEALWASKGATGLFMLGEPGHYIETEGKRQRPDFRASFR